MVSVSRAFVYNVVDVDKILVKTANIDKCAVNVRVISVAYLLG